MTRRATLAITAALQASTAPEQVLLKANGWMPNNEHLPVLLYRAVFQGEREMTAKLEALIQRHGWEPQWRNGIYPFHHYHSTAHEVLAVGAGQASIILGGEGGREFTLRAGDIAVLPCGTGHCRVSASADFLVSGAYGLRQQWDLRREAPTSPARARMRHLPFPAKDPVGADLSRYWKRP
jgi:uncharacterized protein YjlB